MPDDLFLSLIFPAHNEEHRLPPSLAAAHAYLRRQPYSSEILVVENGSRDLTAVVAEAFAAEHDRPEVRVIRERGRGKGLAVRRGMLEARGQYRFFADVDLSMPIEDLAKFLPPRLNGYDVAIGSREAPGSRRFNEPAYRHFQGRVFSNLVKLLALPDFEDTQCGFKCFTAAAARDLFSVQLLDGMSFDVEVLFIARRRGYKIVEVPIDWYYRSESRVDPIREPLRMLRDILIIRRNWAEGRYEIGKKSRK
ncbi:MAG: glycosyltransferase family 2 protein [Anaerolineales bacterium]|nr:glycosyltransferase family 2 protein [Anaerolineales bacterium]